MDFENKIICIARGGLGNRLKSIASCYYIALESKRQLIVDWEINDACSIGFSEIFNSNIVCKKYIEFITDNSLLISNVDVVKTYLPELMYINKISKPNYVNMKSHKGNIFVFYPDYIRGLTASNLKIFFNKNKIHESIYSKVDNFVHCNFGMRIAGVHMRLTDFERSKYGMSYYIRSIENLLKKNKFDKIFICSDSCDAEKFISKKFNNNVIFYEKSSFPVIKNSNSSWANNILRTRASVIDSVIDLYILSKTKIVIYNIDSTFSHIALLLSANRIVYNRNFYIRNTFFKIIKYFNEKFIKKII